MRVDGSSRFLGRHDAYEILKIQREKNQIDKDHHRIGNSNKCGGSQIGGAFIKKAFQVSLIARMSPDGPTDKTSSWLPVSLSTAPCVPTANADPLPATP